MKECTSPVKKAGGSKDGAGRIASRVHSVPGTSTAGQATGTTQHIAAQQTMSKMGY